ncbi:MAG: 3-dehydroquinate synthase [Fibrobacterota bacterium]
MIVPVQIPSGDTYPLCIDENRSLAAALNENVRNGTCVIVTNTTLADLYAEVLQKLHESLDLPVETVVLPDGEKYKTREQLFVILDTMLKKRLDRDTTVIAFGGGVIGDMAGFAAAIFLRGVPYIQVPTTLLAMVDSSVGGKTAVNHPMGKNLIGSFYQPRLVHIDTTFLQTLPEREYRAGCGEIMKYGFIGGTEMFTFIRTRFTALLSGEPQALREAVRRSVEIKARIVEEDETEQGCRALLNFGHTFGHAFEKVLGYGTLLHGEAVLWGIVCALKLAERRGLISPADRTAFHEIKTSIVLPPIDKKPTPEELYEEMFSDKKTRGGTIRFVLPTTAGASDIFRDIPRKDVLTVLREVLEA